MTTYEPNKQRVWIELEVPAIIEKPDGPLTHSQKEAKALGNFVPDIPARRVLMEARAKLASNMLRRLGVEGEDRIVVIEEKGLPYYAALTSAQMLTAMNDNGLWFNLGYLGRDDGG